MVGVFDPPRILEGVPTMQAHKCFNGFLINHTSNWGERIRTYECPDQNRMPYRLATPHF
jgi:hypothetical protein